jgi:hypothetical protein
MTPDDTSRCRPDEEEKVRRRVHALCGVAAIVLAVSVAGCGGNDSRAGNVVLETQTTVPAASPSDAVHSATSPSVDAELTTLDAKLAESQTALDEFDQMTATTEGDPSR